MAWRSTQSAAIDALVAMFLGAAAPGGALAGVMVVNGPQVSSGSNREALLVGWAGERMSTRGTYPEPEEPEFTSNFAVEGLSAARSREKYTVRSTVKVLKGASDGMTAARERAYDIVSACAGLVTANSRLGGAVMFATIGTSSYTPDQTPKGPLATVLFTIDCDAFTNR